MDVNIDICRDSLTLYISFRALDIDHAVLSNASRHLFHSALIGKSVLLSTRLSPLLVLREIDNTTNSMRDGWTEHGRESPKVTRPTTAAAQTRSGGAFNRAQSANTGEPKSWWSSAEPSNLQDDSLDQRSARHNSLSY